VDEHRWEARYAAGETPWDGNVVSADLVGFVGSHRIGGRVLEVGCGTGTQAVWLASQGLPVTAVDIAPTAIAKARERAAAAGVEADFRVGDVLAALPGGPYGLVFDRGVLHGMQGDERARLADRVHAALAPDGWWLSLLGSADEPSDAPGPPRWTLAEIAAALEPRFRIERVVATTFDDTTLGWSPKAWRVEARPR
jgi:SAM-dependent methyltransferase